MNLSIAGSELGKNQGSLPFQGSIVVISLIVQCLGQFIVRIARLGVFFNGPSIFFHTVLGSAQ